MHANAASAHRVSAPRLRARVARDATNHARRLCTAVRARPDDARDDADERERAGERVMDWREFRARLIARDTSNETLAALVDAAAAEGGAAWAHGLPNAEKGAILVARDEDAASFWSHVVILLIDHREYGSTGVIINRTKSTTLAEECPEVSRRKNNLYWNALSSEVVGIGGPVGLSSPHDRSVIALTTKEQPGLTDEIVPGIHVVTDLDSLALMNSKFTGPGTLAPSDLSLFVGYSGWAPGQLQSEIDVGFWNVASASGGFIRDSMFRNVMDTIVDPDGKRRPIDAHGFRAWASMCANLGLQD